MNIKAFSLFMISTLIIGGMWISSCISDNILSDIIINTQSTITDDPQHAEEPEKPQCVITYPQFGKYGFQNILADDFVEAVPFSDNQVEYSVSVDVPVGASLKIVIKTIHEDSLFHWGVYAAHTIENWHVSTYDNVSRSNTLTVYESGKTAHVIVQIDTDCMIEYYENGANTPTKVKIIKLNTDAIVEKPDTKDVTYSGVITYPKFGKFGLLNVLDTDFVEATPFDERLTEYSVCAEVPAGAGLKIVIKSIIKAEAWGVYYPHSVENWHVASYDNSTGSNTLTFGESGKTSNVTIQFDNDCIVEFYENGAKTPTKVKEIKVIR